MKYIERIANLAIILAVAVFLTVEAHDRLFRHPVPPPPTPTTTTLVGKTLRLPGVHFPAQRDTLVLAVSTACHFCNDSLPFYRRLTDRLQGKLDTVAVLPQAQAEAETWLKGAGVSQIQVVSAPLGSIGVYATPTLLLIDESGKVRNSWVGEQDKTGEAKILAAALGGVTAVPRN